MLEHGGTDGTDRGAVQAGAVALEAPVQCTVATRHGLVRGIEAAVQEGARTVLVSFEHTVDLDSAAAGALLRVQRWAEEHDCHLVCHKLSPALRGTFDTMRLTGRFVVAD